MKIDDSHTPPLAPLDSSASRKPTMALALGAGGAKGLAHIGAIEEIESQGFEIVAIAGTSMGALIGGIYAMGKMNIYRDWVSALAKFDVFRMLDWTFTGGGLIKGEKIIGTLRELVGDTCIQQLPMPFTAVATDLDREREVWLTHGSLFDAIRASIAIPTIFRPHVIDGRRLLDGALLNPLPVAPLIRETADYLFAVSMDGPAKTATIEPASNESSDESTHLQRRKHGFLNRLLPRSEGKPREPGAWDLLNQSMDLMQANLSRLRLAAYEPDLLIQLPRNLSTPYEFYRARELIEQGREQAREALANWSKSATPLRHA